MQRTTISNICIRIHVDIVVWEGPESAVHEGWVLAMVNCNTVDTAYLLFLHHFLAKINVFVCSPGSRALISSWCVLHRLSVSVLQGNAAGVVGTACLLHVDWTIVFCL